MRVAPRCMGKNKRGKRSEARTKARQERGQERRCDSSRKRQLDETSKEIQVIREDLKRKIGEVKPELKTETVEDEFVFIDYGSDGDSGADAASGRSGDRADVETGAASSNVEHSAGPERPVGEPIARPRDRSRGTEKCPPKTRAPVELKPRRRW